MIPTTQTKPQKPADMSMSDYNFMMAKQAEGTSFEDAKAALVQTKKAYMQEQAPFTSSLMPMLQPGIDAAKEKQAQVESIQNVPQTGVTPEVTKSVMDITQESLTKPSPEKQQMIDFIMETKGLSEADAKTMMSQESPDIIGQAKQGLSTIGSGVKDIYQGTTNENAEEGIMQSGTGWSKIAEGTIGTLLSPISGTLSNLPYGNEIAAWTVGLPLTVPREIYSHIVDYGLEKAGIVEGTPEYEDIKAQWMAPVDVGLMGLGLKKGKKAAETVVKPVGQGIKAAGEKLYETAIKPSTKEAELMQKYEAGILKEKPNIASESALKKGIVGTEKGIGVKSAKQANEIWKKEIEPELKSVEKPMDFTSKFKKIEKEIMKEKEPARRADLLEGLEVLKEDYKDTPSASYIDAQSIKSSLDKFTPQKIFKGKDVVSGWRQVKNKFANEIRNDIYEVLKDPNIKAQYRDYANLKQLEGIGVKARTGGRFKGGFGTFWSGAWDMATTPIKTIGGRTLYKVGNALEFYSTKPVKTFGDYLMLQGLTESDLNSD